MNIKQQVKAINEFLSVVYDGETRLSRILERLGFDSQQIDSLRTLYLEQIIAACLLALKEILISRAGNDRLYIILSFRFGLEGQPEETLHTIGKRLGVTRERVRQLEKRALRKCKHRINKNILESRLARTAAEALGLRPIEPPNAVIELQPKKDSQPESRAQAAATAPAGLNGSGEELNKAYTLDEKRQVYSKAYAKWTEDDDNKLKELYTQGKSISELSLIFQRNEGAINSRLAKLGLMSR